MAVVNPYDPGTPVPLTTYTGSLGDWRAMMKFKPWKDLIEQEVTYNPQWLPDLAPWILPEEKVKDDIPIVQTIVADPWIDPDNGNGPNGTNGNGTVDADTWVDPDTVQSIVAGVDTNGSVIKSPVLVIPVDADES